MATEIRYHVEKRYYVGKLEEQAPQPSRISIVEQDFVPPTIMFHGERLPRDTHIDPLVIGTYFTGKFTVHCRNKKLLMYMYHIYVLYYFEIKERIIKFI